MRASFTVAYKPRGPRPPLIGIRPASVAPLRRDRHMAKDRKATLAGRNMWDELIALRDRQREETKDALQVVKEKDLPLETNPMGQMRWYLHPNLKDTVVNVMMVY